MFSLRSMLVCSVLLAAGCGAHRQFESEPLSLDRELVDRCKAGDAQACEQSLHYRLASTELIAVELRACEAGEAEHCERVARWLNTMGSENEMRSALDRGCALGSTWSCARLVNLMLARHTWIQQCAAREQPERVAAMLLQVTLHGAGRTRPMRLELGPVPPESAELRSCLVDALDHSILPAVRLVGAQRFEITLAPRPGSDDYFASYTDRFGVIEVSVSSEADPSLASCPRGAPSPCRIVPKEAVMLAYRPDPKTEDLVGLRRADTPKQPALTIEYCIDQTGRTRYIHTLDDDGAPTIAAAFVERMTTWRAKSVLMDGEPIFVCTRAVFTVEFVWWGSWIPWPHPRGLVIGAAERTDPRTLELL